MEIIQLLIGTDGVHIGIYTISRLHLILGKRKTLPFSQRVNHLGLGIAQILDWECYRALHAVQIIIDTQALHHEEWGCYTAQAQLGGQVLLEELFYHFDTHFGLAHIQLRLITLRFYQFAHYLVFNIVIVNNVSIF